VGAGRQFTFDRFVLDAGNELLYAAAEIVPLTPKSFSVLRLLVERAGQLVTKDELLDVVWRDTAVTEQILKSNIHLLREALGDDAAAPRFIQTVHRRGYRFIAAVRTRGVDDQPTTAALASPRAEPRGAGAPFVGREVALGLLQRGFEACLAGRRQVFLLSGAAGIGKTAVAASFLAELGAPPRPCIARGSCFPSLDVAQGAAYLPILEALTQLYREARLVGCEEVLRRAMPNWVLLLPPSLIDAGERDALRRSLPSPSPEQMLHEIAEGLDALSEAVPVVLFIEDLHWSDYATLSVLSYLAQRTQPARLLVLLTCRTEELSASARSLRVILGELVTRHACQELALEPLGEADVAAYLRARFAGAPLPEALPRFLYAHTEGHPLFLVLSLDDWLERRFLVREDGGLRLDGDAETLRSSVPSGIRRLVALQIERLEEPYRQLIELASVAGMEFSALELGAVAQLELEETERRCSALARHTPFLRPAGIEEAADGRVAARYTFSHWLYYAAIYEHIEEARRIRLQLRFGELMEQRRGAGGLDREHALAVYFERGLDFVRALAYRRRLAEQALNRVALRDAEANLTHALALAERVPPAMRPDLRIDLLRLRCVVRNFLRDWAGAEADYTHLLDEAGRLGRVDVQIEVHLESRYQPRWTPVERLRAVEHAERLLAGVADDPVAVQAQSEIGFWRLFSDGRASDDVEQTERAVDAARAAADPQRLVARLRTLAYLRLFRAEYHRAIDASDEGIRIAQDSCTWEPYLFCLTAGFLARARLGRWAAVQRLLRQIQAARPGNLAVEESLAVYECTMCEFVGHFDLASTERQRTVMRRSFRPQARLQVALYEGRARLAEGRFDEAWRAFAGVGEALDRERIHLGWYVDADRRLALCDYWAARGELSRARHEAEAAIRLWRRAGERAQVALLSTRLAQLALAEGELTLAAEELEQAAASLRDVDAPPVEWQVLATATALDRARGNDGAAGAKRARSRAIVEQLAAELRDAPELWRAFTRAPAVQAVLEPG
jgi:DNA-binding winged helix-turn-helix (wHTH) protein